MKTYCKFMEGFRILPKEKSEINTQIDVNKTDRDFSRTKHNIRKLRVSSDHSKLEEENIQKSIDAYIDLHWEYEKVYLAVTNSPMYYDSPKSLSEYP